MSHVTASPGPLAGKGNVLGRNMGCVLKANPPASLSTYQAASETVVGSDPSVDRINNKASPKVAEMALWWHSDRTDCCIRFRCVPTKADLTLTDQNAHLFLWFVM